MNLQIHKTRRAIQRYGKKICKRDLVPAVKKWAKKHGFDEVAFCNGRAWVLIKGDNIFPQQLAELLAERMSEQKVLIIVNQLIELGNCQYELGFYIPESIKV